MCVLCVQSVDHSDVNCLVEWEGVKDCMFLSATNVSKTMLFYP